MSTEYEELLNEALDNNIVVKEKNLLAFKGLTKGKRIAIKKDMSMNEKACILAEELGHAALTVGDILDQSKVENRKQEHKARVWGYNLMIGLEGIINAYEHRCRNLFEVADFLNVTEDYLKEVITSYKEKYGLCTKVDNYIIYFEPSIAVIKMLFKEDCSVSE